MYRLERGGGGVQRIFFWGGRWGRDGSYGFGGETKGGGVSRRQIGRKGGLGLEGNGREWEGIIRTLQNPTGIL